MPYIKPSNLIKLKEIVRGRGDAFEREFLDKLPAEVVQLYKFPALKPWIPSSLEVHIMQRAAELFFPDSAHRMRDLAHMLAQMTMTGIYRVFLAIPTPTFVIKRVAQIWRLFYQHGHARIIDTHDGGATLEVVELPDLEDYQKEFIAGYVAATLELANAGDVRVTFDGSNPAAWRWVITWFRR